MSEATLEKPAVMKPSEAGTPMGNLADLAGKYGQKVPHKPDLVARRETPANTPEPTSQENKEPEDDFDPAKFLEENKEAGKQKNFVRNTIDKNKELEAQNQELANKLKKYEAEEVPALTTRIQELEQKINDTNSKKESDRLQAELDGIQKLVSNKDAELNEYKKRLKFLDLPNDPDFKRDFEQPVNSAYNRALMGVGSNETLQNELHKAFMALQAHHKATDPQEKGRQYQLATEIANGISEQLSPVQQQQFNGAFYGLYENVGKYAEALNNHELTARQIEEQRIKNLQDQTYQVKQRWGTAYKDSFSKVQNETKYSEDIARIIAANKIDDITSEDESIAVGSFDPDSQQYAPEQLTRLLAQGAAYKRLKATNEALRAQLAEQQETINKFRGSSTAGSAINAPAQVQQKEDEPKTVKGLYSRWQTRLANK